MQIINSKFDPYPNLKSLGDKQVSYFEKILIISILRDSLP